MNEVRAILDDTLSRLFGEMVTHVLIQRAEEGEWPGKLWDAVEESGLTRAHVPESFGGAGGGWGEAFLILTASGRHAVPLPLAETILGAWLLARSGLEPPDGPLTILPDLLSAEQLSGDRLACRAGRVPWGAVARHAVFMVEGAEGARVGLVETKTARIIRGESVAREPRDDLVFENAPVLNVAPSPLPAGSIRMYGAMIRSAQMAGALGYLLTQSVKYAGERVQFGRPIRKFQMIQDQLARLAGHAAASQVAAEAAFCAADRAMDQGSREGSADPGFEIAVAKVRAGEAAAVAPGIAHQVHGALGFTYEHTLHFATRRLWSWRWEYGTENEWAALIGRKSFEAGPDGLWPLVTSR